MKPNEVASLVSEAIVLERQIETLAERLGVIRALLISGAEQLLQEETGLGDLRGMNYTLKDPEGHAAALISFPRDKVIGSFWFRTQQGREVAYRYKNDKLVELGPLKELAGDQFKYLFFPMFKPAKGFTEILPLALKRCPKRVERLLELCTEPSSPRCSIKRKEAEARSDNHRGTEVTEHSVTGNR